MPHISEALASIDEMVLRDTAEQHVVCADVCAMALVNTFGVHRDLASPTQAVRALRESLLLSMRNNPRPVNAERLLKHFLVFARLEFGDDRATATTFVAVMQSGGRATMAMIEYFWLAKGLFAVYASVKDSVLARYENGRDLRHRGKAENIIHAPSTVVAVTTNIYFEMVSHLGKTYGIDEATIRARPRLFALFLCLCYVIDSKLPRGESDLACEYKQDYQLRAGRRLRRMNFNDRATHRASMIVATHFRTRDLYRLWEDPMDERRAKRLIPEVLTVEGRIRLLERFGDARPQRMQVS